MLSDRIRKTWYRKPSANWAASFAVQHHSLLTYCFETHILFGLYSLRCYTNITKVQYTSTIRASRTTCLDWRRSSRLDIVSLHSLSCTVWSDWGLRSGSKYKVTYLYPHHTHALYCYGEQHAWMKRFNIAKFAIAKRVAVGKINQSCQNILLSLSWINAMLFQTINIRLVGSDTTPQINKPSCQQYNKIAAYITPNKWLNASSEFISVEELTKVYD